MPKLLTDGALAGTFNVTFSANIPPGFLFQCLAYYFSFVFLERKESSTSLTRLICFPISQVISCFLLFSSFAL